MSKVLFVADFGDLVSMLTGLHIAVRDNEWLTVYKGEKKLSVTRFHSEEGLETMLWEILYRHARRQVGLSRVKRALAERKDWTDEFDRAVEDYGWDDSQELADAANVPQATNVRVVASS